MIGGKGEPSDQSRLLQSRGRILVRQCSMNLVSSSRSMIQGLTDPSGCCARTTAATATSGYSSMNSSASTRLACLETAAPGVSRSTSWAMTSITSLRSLGVMDECSRRPDTRDRGCLNPPAFALRRIASVGMMITEVAVKKRGRKLRRRAVRKARREAKARDEKAREEKAGGSPRIRRDFVAKARSGDQVRLEFHFSGDAVPIDPERPAESLAERVAARAAWRAEGFPPLGADS